MRLYNSIVFLDDPRDEEQSNFGGNPTGILISKKIHDFMQEKGLAGKVMIIDGSFYEKNVKTCGCCGPPPSLDYRVQLLDDENVPEELRNPKQFTRVQNKMPIIVEQLLFSAVEAAKQQIIVMMDEDTRGGYRIFAKIM